MTTLLCLHSTFGFVKIEVWMVYILFEAADISIAMNINRYIRKQGQHMKLRGEDQHHPGKAHHRSMSTQYTYRCDLELVKISHSGDQYPT